MSATLSAEAAEAEQLLDQVLSILDLDADAMRATQQYERARREIEIWLEHERSRAYWQGRDEFSWR